MIEISPIQTPSILLPYNQMDRYHNQIERHHNHLPSDLKLIARTTRNMNLRDNPELTSSMEKQSEKVLQSVANQVNSSVRGRIRVIRTRFPGDFFCKLDSNRVDDIPECKVKLETTAILSCNKVQDKQQLEGSNIATTRRAYLENGSMGLKSYVSNEAQQTANFFYSNSSQSTDAIGDASTQQTEANTQKLQNAIKRNSKSKAEHRRDEPIPLNITNRGLTAFPTPRAPSLSFGGLKHSTSKAKQLKASQDSFGYTFFKKKMSSTPSSPPRYSSNNKQGEQNNASSQKNNDYLSKKRQFDEKSQLIKDRYGSKTRKASKQDKYQDKIMQNLWKEPLAPSKKGLILPHLNAK